MDLKVFFRMSRRERRGTIVVLAVVAVLMIGSLAYRSCRSESSVTRQATMIINQFEAEADTVTIAVDKTKKEGKSHRGKHSKPHGKPARSPQSDKPARRLDPVPQF